jgi:aryl-alcohol dehydrogenase-like predicted oxidoreductase
MNFRPLGRTGIQVSQVSFGAGPVPGLMTNRDNLAAQRETIGRALEAGINWFDTAATYGDGRSESALGAALRAPGGDRSIHVATKVRLMADDLDRIKERVKESVGGSLRRLGVERLTLLQLHNAVTRNRGDQPTSLTMRDVLGRNGVLDAFAELQSDGVIQHFGLTGLGDDGVLREVIAAGPWAAIQLCVDLLHPLPSLLEACEQPGLGVIAIRVLAGGALASQSPSAHTLKTKFFPLAIYEEDQKKAAQLAARLPKGLSLKEAAVRFVTGQNRIATALIGFADAGQIDEVVRFAEAGPLPNELLQKLFVGDLR